MAYKFFQVCKQVHNITEKSNTMLEKLARDAVSVSSLQSKHTNFEHGLQTPGCARQPKSGFYVKWKVAKRVERWWTIFKSTLRKLTIAKKTYPLVQELLADAKEKLLNQSAGIITRWEQLQSIRARRGRRRGGARCARTALVESKTWSNFLINRHALFHLFTRKSVEWILYFCF